MADLFHVKGAFSFRSPVCLASGFKMALIALDDGSSDGHAINVLCHRISSSLDCPAFPLDLDDQRICAVFEASRKKEVTTWLQELGKTSPCVQEMVLDDDDEIANGLLLRQAILECLLSSMISRGWTRLNGQLLVFGSLQEKTTTYETISVDVQLSTGDQIVILLSADVVTLHPTKAVETMPEACKRSFEAGNEVLTEDYMWKLDEWAPNDHECCVLPSLRQGHIVGFKKSLGNHENEGMDRLREMWLHKNGLEVPSVCYYIKVCFDINADDTSWFPASLVITKAGLIPVSPSNRCSRLFQVVEHCKSDISDWNYFGAGKVVLKELVPSSNPPVTEKASFSAEITANGLDITKFSDLKMDDLRKSLRAKEYVEPDPKMETLPQEIPTTSIIPPKPRLIKAPIFKRAHATAKQREIRQLHQSNGSSASLEPGRFSDPHQNEDFSAVMKPSRRPKEPPEFDKENKRFKTSSQKCKKIQTGSAISTSKTQEPSNTKLPKTAKRTKKSDGSGTSSAKDSVENSSFKQKLQPEETSRPNEVPGLQFPTDGESSHAGGSGNDIAKMSSAGNDAGKKVTEAADTNESLVLRKHAEGKLKDLNVADLKSFLRTRKCKVGGKKDELVQRVCELLS